MSLFAAHTAAIFAGPLAVEAVYKPKDGAEVTLRAIRRAPDDALAFSDSRISRETAVFLIPVAKVAAPVAGDQIVCNGKTHTVKGVPERDSSHLYWRIEAPPQKAP